MVFRQGCKKRWAICSRKSPKSKRNSCIWRPRWNLNYRSSKRSFEV
ncbi:hypothetical protein Goklo_025088, partial [Gossypium klotzschianum]|nr:hypothetical protein [Gossypium klotzschianum]